MTKKAATKKSGINKKTTVRKKTATRKKVAAARRQTVSGAIKSTATEVVEEVEKASDVVLREIRESFDFITGKVTDTARFATATTRAVTQKVTSEETVQMLQGLLKDVEEIAANAKEISRKIIEKINH